MRPSRHYYYTAGQGEQDTIESAIQHQGMNDIYIALGPLPTKEILGGKMSMPEKIDSETDVSLSIYHNPLISVVWIGVAVMVIGGLVAIAEKSITTPRSQTV